MCMACIFTQILYGIFMKFGGSATVNDIQLLIANPTHRVLIFCDFARDGALFNLKTDYKLVLLGFNSCNQRSSTKNMMKHCVWQASDFALQLHAQPRNRTCDSVGLAETQTTRSGPEDLVIPRCGTRNTSRYTYRVRLGWLAASIASGA